MLISALQLERCLLRTLHLQANDAPTKKGGQYKITIKTNFSRSGASIRIPLHVTMVARKGEIMPPLKKLVVEVLGVFSLGAELNDDNLRFVFYNCLTILYGVMRGMVHNSTGSVQGGPLLVPSVNMEEIVADFKFDSSEPKDAASTPAAE